VKKNSRHQETHIILFHFTHGTAVACCLISAFVICVCSLCPRSALQNDPVSWSLLVWSGHGSLDLCRSSEGHCGSIGIGGIMEQNPTTSQLSPSSTDTGKLSSHALRNRLLNPNLFTLCTAGIFYRFQIKVHQTPGFPSLRT